MNVNNMTRKEFEALPHREWNKRIEFDSLIILPGKSRDLHDSGYRNMDFVAVKDGEPLCLLSGCSDVIHIEGIGGYGYNWLEKYNTIPSLIPPVGWNIDCLSKSGLLRVFCGFGRITCGLALSSFEIYSMKEDKE